MQAVVSIFYILLALLALWYLFYLMSARSKPTISLGKNKKLIKTLRQYNTIKRNHTQRKQDMFTDAEQLFYRGSTVNYRKLLDSLIKIKTLQIKAELNDEDYIVPQIDMLIELIKEDQRYLLVAPNRAQLFQNLSDAINNSSKEGALKALEQLYTEYSVYEDSVRSKRSKEFWCGTAIGLLGLVFSIIQLIIQK